MSEKRLLDCTLRDGGYVNGWRFGKENITGIFDRLVDAGLEFVEVGFLDERVAFSRDRSILPDTASVEKIFGGRDRKGTKVLAMIDYGTCGLGRIQPCGECFLDGIRVIFKKHLREPALEFCGQLKSRGYMVFAQLVSVTSYSDEEMADLIRLANQVKPDAISVVDTYGLLHQNNLSHYIDLLDEGLDPEITIGYHGHNNFQMGYANGISVLGRESSRDLHVDGSLYGMGKSAGNAPTELLAMYMSDRYGKCYDISQLLEAIENSVMPFYNMPPWGYSMFYFLAAYNGCHPNYVQYYMDKKKLSVKAINQVLASLEGEKKLLFDEDYADFLYRGFRE